VILRGSMLDRGRTAALAGHAPGRMLLRRPPAAADSGPWSAPTPPWPGEPKSGTRRRC